VEDGFVAEGEFVVSGGDGPVAFESVDSAFDGVPGSVVVRAEPGRAAASAAAFLRWCCWSALSGWLKDLTIPLV
jgi:hypothetical protein